MFRMKWKSHNSKKYYFFGAKVTPTDGNGRSRYTADNKNNEEVNASNLLNFKAPSLDGRLVNQDFPVESRPQPVDLRFDQNDQPSP